MKEILIEKNDAGQRLDRFLKKYLAKAPLSVIYMAVRKDVKVNGKRQKEDYSLAEGDKLCLYMLDSDIEKYTEKKARHSAKRQFTIAYEDDNLIVVGKPFGLLVHGDKTEKKDTLTNQVTDYLIQTGAYVPRLEKSFAPSPVHRLDRNTTGLVVFGKNASSLRQLAAMMQEDGPVRKFYYTIVVGELKETLHLKNRLLKDEEKNRVRILDLNSKEGKYIETVAVPLYSSGKFTLVEVELVTGRSHQIRAHLKYAGYPIIGDAKYGNKEINLKLEKNIGLTTQLLHAGKLQFTDTEGELEYLKGKVISCPVSSAFEAIEKELLGKVTEK